MTSFVNINVTEVNSKKCVRVRTGAVMGHISLDQADSTCIYEQTLGINICPSRKETEDKGIKSSLSQKHSMCVLRCSTFTLELHFYGKGLA